MRKLLVTGGAGFIGANFVRYRLQQYPGDRLVVLDALTYAGHLGNLESVRERPQFRFVQGNICDEDLVVHLMREESVDTVVHFAAESHVDRSITSPDAFLQTNITGTHCLLKAARRLWLDERTVHQHRFHHVSTDEVFGSLEPDDPASTESSPYAPNSPYAASKAASDHLVRAYHRTYGLSITMSHSSNNYGPYQFPEKLIPHMIFNILEGHKLPVYGDGRNIRDWLHVEDHCRALEAVLNNGRVGETYNIGGGVQCENIILVRALCRIADEAFASDTTLSGRFPHSPAAWGASADLIQFVSDRLGHDRRYALNGEKAVRELGFELRRRLSEGLMTTFHWYLKRRLGASRNENREQRTSDAISTSND